MAIQSDGVKLEDEDKSLTDTVMLKAPLVTYLGRYGVRSM
jgi:hypothetical protein